MANVSNVTAGKPKVGGAVSVGATTLTLPTAADAELVQGFENLGYIGEDGMTQAITRDSEKIKAWGGDTVLITQTDFGETFKFKLIEVMNVAVKKEVFGPDNVSGTLATGISVSVNSKDLPERAWVIDTIQNRALSRIVVPRGKVSEVGEITYQDGDAVGYEVTVSALPDENGNCSHEYTKEA